MDIETRVADLVGIATLNRPQVLNALNTMLLDELACGGSRKFSNLASEFREFITRWNNVCRFLSWTDGKQRAITTATFEDGGTRSAR
jgi:hypothetical protein